jgi:hypothetical protein
MMEDGTTEKLLFKQFRTGFTGILKHIASIPTIDEFRIISKGNWLMELYPVKSFEY